MNKRLLDTLAEIWAYREKGYAFCWKPKSRSKLQEMGLVYSEPSRHWNESVFYLTEAGKKALSLEPQE